MRSIRPGRGPSKIGFAGSIFGIVFGIFWTILAFGMTRNAGLIGVIFPLFGVLFVGMGIAQAVYHYKNASGKGSSLFDIVDEPDAPHSEAEDEQMDVRYCGYCGQRLQGDMLYCTKCGRKQDGTVQ